jgi:GT2 family glycosyltransferase
MKNSNNIKVARPLENNPLAEYVVEVIIPYKENYKRLQDLLIKLDKTRNINFLVTLVDDNSCNLDFHKNFENVHGLKIIRLDEDKGFGYAVNEAVKQSMHELFIVMHSDVSNIDLNTLKNLLKGLIASKKDNVAAIAACTDIPLPKECDFLKADHAVNSEYVLLNNNQFIPFICTAFHKTPFSKVGGFPTYPYCLFEDKLLCKKLKIFGYNLAYCPTSFCRHVGGESVKKLIGRNDKVLEKLKNNKILFQKDCEVLENYLAKNKT